MSLTQGKFSLLNNTLSNGTSFQFCNTKDIVDGKWENSLFCATLRARDTNRIASVGTIMQVIDVDDRSIRGARTWPGDILPTLHRVVCNCKAVGTVDVIEIEGHEYKEDDYLIAKVKVRGLEDDCPTTSDTEQLVNDYQKVRSIYINSQSLAFNELPNFARKAMHTMPTFDVDSLRDKTAFWMMIETWQMLCNTIQQSKRTALQGIINEMSVTVAMQTKKGPLELPIKRESLPLEVQKSFEDIEENASRDFMELGMDPVLDFQELLQIEDHADRVEKFAWMVARERSRLEAKESLIRAFLEEEFGDELLIGNYTSDSRRNAFN